MALVTNDAIAALRRRQGLIQIKGLSEAANCDASLLLQRTVSSLVAGAPLAMKLK
jgi:hypothetical protein